MVGNIQKLFLGSLSVMYAQLQLTSDIPNSLQNSSNDLSSGKPVWDAFVCEPPAFVGDGYIEDVELIMLIVVFDDALVELNVDTAISHVNITRA